MRLTELPAAAPPHNAGLLPRKELRLPTLRLILRPMITSRMATFQARPTRQAFDMMAHYVFLCNIILIQRRGVCTAVARPPGRGEGPPASTLPSWPSSMPGPCSVPER